ncbi:MAG: hypothetical protein OJF50_000261 [Nitrospira sp.]|jgi:iron complex outermembrane recepter protein|nr:hypothetical protein [Nitrospira sp.]
MSKVLLRVDEAAHMLSVSRWTIYRWVAEGRLKATKIGRGSLRVFKDSVETLVDQGRTDAMGDAGALPGASSTGKPSARRGEVCQTRKRSSGRGSR